MFDRPVILTGFMGSGKSSVGRILARSLGCPFIDLDAEIVADAGKSINQIFSDEGEAAFRARESSTLERTLHGGVKVIATGGGVVISELNRQLMRNKGFVINLTASLSTIMARLEGATDRPLYGGQDAANRVRALMDDRKQFYADADIRIDTDKISVEDVSAKILRILKGLPS